MGPATDIAKTQQPIPGGLGFRLSGNAQCVNLPSFHIGLGFDQADFFGREAVARAHEEEMQRRAAAKARAVAEQAAAKKHAAAAAAKRDDKAATQRSAEAASQESRRKQQAAARVKKLAAIRRQRAAVAKSTRTAPRRPVSDDAVPDLPLEVMTGARWKNARQNQLRAEAAPPVQRRRTYKCEWCSDTIDGQYCYNPKKVLFMEYRKGIFCSRQCQKRAGWNNFEGTKHTVQNGQIVELDFIE